MLLHNAQIHQFTHTVSQSSVAGGTVHLGWKCTGPSRNLTDLVLNQFLHPRSHWDVLRAHL